MEENYIKNLNEGFYILEKDLVYILRSLDGHIILKSLDGLRGLILYHKAVGITSKGKSIKNIKKTDPFDYLNNIINDHINLGKKLQSLFRFIKHFTELESELEKSVNAQTPSKYTEEPLNQLDPYNRCPRGQSLGD